MLNYNLEAPKEKILEVLGISNEKFNHLLKIFSIDTDTSQFNKKQLDAFIQYLNFTKECIVNINYDDSIFTEYPKRKPFTLEEIINFKKKTTAPKRIAATINKKELITKKSEVPLLADIPFLGWLFKYESKKENKTNLSIVFELIYEDDFTTNNFNVLVPNKID